MSQRDVGGCGIGIPQHDQILVPVEGDTVKVFPLMQLFGVNRRMLRSYEGFGHAPLHFITQRGPLQNGETLVDMRYDPRIIQIMISESIMGATTMTDRRYMLTDLLRPSRSFGASGVVTQCVYRRWLPGGKVERGTDLVTENGTNAVTSVTGRFADRGLTIGQPFIITTGADAGTYHVTGVPNDYTVYLSANMGATATNIHWQFNRGRGIRDLNCVMQAGPNFNTDSTSHMRQYGYIEALRFIAYDDPFWNGTQQYQSFIVPDEIGDLVFDGLGAWFGPTHGVGRWLFTDYSISDILDIMYWGTYEAKPTVVISGPASNVNISNDTTGDSMVLGYNVLVGESVTIDTDKMTVTSSTGADLHGYLTGDFATFGLFPDPKAPNRINTISVSLGDGDPLTTAVILYWKNKYVSI